MYTSPLPSDSCTIFTKDEVNRIRSQHSDQMAMTLLPALLLLSIIMFVGFIGNILVFYVYFTKFTPSSARSAILAMACYDLVTCLFSIPGEIVDMRFSYSFTSEVMCRGLRMVTTIILVASGLLLVLVAVDRFQRICRPLNDHYTSKDIWKRIFLLSLLAAVIAIPSPIMYGLSYTAIDITNSDKLYKNQTLYGLECSTSEAFKNHPLQRAYSILLLAVFLVAFTIMIILYILIGKQVLRHHSFVKAVRQGSGHVLDKPHSSHQDNNEPSFVEVKESSVLHEMDQDKESPTHKESIAKKTDEKKSQSRKQSVMHRIRKVSQAGDSRTRKTTMMLFCITIVFVISFLPHIILKATQAFNKHFDQNLNTTGIVMYNIFVRSYFFNTAVNFFVYGFCSPKFRAECKALVFSFAFLIKKRRASIKSDDIQ
ncbi:cholecystokinin receptor [Biomphalaria pfeifferi]|uniref:Cholecystokinin receptor n=1 Tax=Biomphalaria pfeifferi TaxID=112525 RepID=A0AAD8BQI0_BIOPF|nr:cholecystokinin receptor [Biomphalaria pfeifferi]